MAFRAGGVIEIRDTGLSTNGAYYDVTIANHGTDYSQSDTPILSHGDGDCNNSTTFTSALGGFTSAMIGNGIYLSGTGINTSIYVVTTVASSNSITLDRNPTTATHATSVNYSVGGANTTFDFFVSQFLPGNIVYIKTGTYSWGTITVPAGAPAAATKFIGYKANRNDKCIGADRPSITISATWTTQGATKLRNLIVTSSFNGSTLTLGTRDSCDNVKATNTNASSNLAFSGGITSAFTRCEGVSTHGIAFGNNVAFAYDCYAHDSVTGFDAGIANGSITNCVIDTCTTGVNSTASSVKVTGCTIYNCTTGLAFDLNGTLSEVYNCIITNCTTGINNSITNNSNYINDFNVFNNNTNAVNMPLEDNCIIADPLLKDPANGDFTLKAGSPAIGIAAQQGATTGTVGNYNVNVGVYQNVLIGQVWSVA